MASPHVMTAPAPFTIAWQRKVTIGTATPGLHICGSRCTSSGARLTRPNMDCITAAVATEATPLTQSREQPHGHCNTSGALLMQPHLDCITAVVATGASPLKQRWGSHTWTASLLLSLVQLLLGKVDAATPGLHHYCWAVAAVTVAAGIRVTVDTATSGLHLPLLLQLPWAWLM